MKKKFSSNLSFEVSSNSVELTEELYDKLSAANKLIVKIATANEIGIKMSDLKCGVYQERYYLDQASLELIHSTIF